MTTHIHPKTIFELNKASFTGLKPSLTLKNPMQAPKLVKVVIGCGVGSLKDKKKLELVADRLSRITGQKPALRGAKKSIASFKVRQGDPVGYQITLRGKRMTDFVDRLDRYHALGLADDSDSKTDGAFIVREPVIRSRALNAPRVEALRLRGLKFDLRKIQAGRAGPEIAGQRSGGYLRPLVVIDCEVPVLEVALIGALDPNLCPESFANHNSRWCIPHDDTRCVRFNVERNRCGCFCV